MNVFLRLHSFSMRFDQLLNEWGGSLLSLGLRGFIGWQFFKAGQLKLSDWSATLSLFREEYTVPLLPPELAAFAGTGGEVIFSILLLIGFFSRPAALGLLAVNVMAVISYPQLWQFECPAAINDHFYWGILLLVLIAFGPGRLSLDHLLKKMH
ncbi:DoxX family protein [Undibacterium sp. SXout7W]|uniref:DoxX family protein n=1 Tax=Undibacterium sp. SXout7W TaxID=3413049 RepID=UPI003BF33C44